MVELSKRYFPSMSSSYANPKLELVIDDGLSYVSRLADASFDVIITDSSDPQGPAESLFEREYYATLERKLASDGVICCQAESVWFELEFIRKLMEVNREIFAQVAYASTMTCTYPSGQIGFLVCSKSSAAACKLGKPLRRLDEQEAKRLDLRYYNADIHEAAFVLPTFVRNKLYGRD